MVRVACFPAQASNSGSLEFAERGTRQLGNGDCVEFSNAYRWELVDKNELQLSHLRRGRDNAVQLLIFKNHCGNHWQATAPYYCGSDVYRAELWIGEDAVVLQWDIQGDKKNIQIKVQYS